VWADDSLTLSGRDKTLRHGYTFAASQARKYSEWPTISERVTMHVLRDLFIHSLFSFLFVAPGIGALCTTVEDCKCGSDIEDQHLFCNPASNICECMAGYHYWQPSTRCVNCKTTSRYISWKTPSIYSCLVPTYLIVVLNYLHVGFFPSSL
jgi:hypothetical protein